jgi:hypothetical protein
MHEQTHLLNNVCQILTRDRQISALARHWISDGLAIGDDKLGTSILKCCRRVILRHACPLKKIDGILAPLQNRSLGEHVTEMLSMKALNDPLKESH